MKRDAKAGRDCIRTHGKALMEDGRDEGIVFLASSNQLSGRIPFEEKQEWKVIKKRNIWMWAAVAAVAVAMGGAAGCGRGAESTWGEMLDALGDAGEFARLEGKGAEATFYFSSSDPTGGNDDYNRFAGTATTPGWVVLADVEGPGVLDRFWMTGVDEGYRMKVFVDGGDRKSVV